MPSVVSLAKVAAMKSFSSLCLVAAVAAGFALGCDSHEGHDHSKPPVKKPDANTTAPTGNATTPAPAGNATKPDGNATKTSATAYPIKVCVVSGEDLGSMGKPEDVVFKDVLVKLCCEGCKEDFEKDPAKFVAILKAGGPKPKAKTETKPKS